MDGGYDFLNYDRVWQRVAPALEPYPPDGPAAEPDAERKMPGRPGNRPVWKPDNGPGNSPAWKPDNGPGNSPAWRPDNGPNGKPVKPGPGWKPCPPFQGADGPETLADFIQEELAEQRQFQAMSRTAPLWARASLRDLAARCAAHARRLSAAFYLSTGERYSPAVSLGEILPAPWGSALRERYQSMVCLGLRYAQAAERSADPCMERLLEELSAASYKSASDLLRMLERGTGA